MQKRTVIKYASYSSATNETLWGIFVNWFLYTINNIYKQEIYHFIALEAWIIPGVLKLGTWLGMVKWICLLFGIHEEDKTNFNFSLVRIN